MANQARKRVLKQLLVKKDEKSFTLIELMIVIAIIGILAAIAIPNFLSYRIRSFNADAQADRKNAYTAGLAYSTDNPGSDVNSGGALTSGSFRSSTSVSTGVSGSGDEFTVSAFHTGGDTTYSMTFEGASGSTS